jgi:hypothetical protein
LIDAGYSKYVWKRLMICVYEDCDCNGRLLCLLDGAYNLLKEVPKDDQINVMRLVLCAIVKEMARAKKSREGDNFISWLLHNREFDMPDWALDKHTGAGRRKGRGLRHFFEEGAKLENKVDRPDRYEAETIRLDLAAEEAEARCKARGLGPKDEELVDEGPEGHDPEDARGDGDALRCRALGGGHGSLL